MITTRMRQTIKNLLAEILVEMGATDAGIAVEIPENPTHGDYTTNVAMLLAGRLKAPPIKIAQQIVDSIIKHQKESLSLEPQWLEKAEVAPPGFINLWLSKEYFGSQIDKVLKEKEHYGNSLNTQDVASSESISASNAHKKSPTAVEGSAGPQKQPKKASKIGKNDSTSTNHAEKEGKKGDIASFGNMLSVPGRRIVLEFTDPNPFKEFHVGHLYSNAVGESVSRLLSAIGHTVRRVNYQGDVGMHVSKSLWGLTKLFKEEGLTIEKMSLLPLVERVRLLGRAYAMGATVYEEDEAAKEEMKDINYLVFISAQEYLKEKEGWTPQVDYRQHVKVDAQKLTLYQELYQKGRTWSLEYFEAIYRRLGTHFDGYYFESIVGEYGVEIIKKFMGQGIFEESDGAIVFRGEKFGLHTRVFINSLGLPTYEAKELGLAPTKYKDWPYDVSIILTGKEIDEYFRVLIAAIKATNPELGAKTFHKSHGMVRLPEGKMSSRTGKVLLGEWLLEEVKKKVEEVVKQNVSNYTVEEQKEITEASAIAAIKYSLLRVGLPADIAFDLEASVSFEGESGPYLLYTYARSKSLLRKAQQESTDSFSNASFGGIELNEEERIVARRIAQFPDVVAAAARNFAPNTLCTYLFDLAQEFNGLYAKHSILGQPHRLALTSAVAQVLKNGLYLLGIQTVERM